MSPSPEQRRELMAQLAYRVRLLEHMVELGRRLQEAQAVPRPKYRPEPKRWEIGWTAGFLILITPLLLVAFIMLGSRYIDPPWLFVLPGLITGALCVLLRLLHNLVIVPLQAAKVATANAEVTMQLEAREASLRELGRTRASTEGELALHQQRFPVLEKYQHHLPALRFAITALESHQASGTIQALRCYQALCDREGADR